LFHSTILCVYLPRKVYTNVFTISEFIFCYSHTFSQMKFQRQTSHFASERWRKLLYCVFVISFYSLTIEHARYSRRSISVRLEKERQLTFFLLNPIRRGTNGYDSPQSLDLIHVPYSDTIVLPSKMPITQIKKVSVDKMNISLSLTVCFTV